MTREIAVVGAGAVGVTAAHDLAMEGVNVTVYEKSGIAAGSTGRAAGLVYDVSHLRPQAKLLRRSLDRFRAFSNSRPNFTFTERPYLWFTTTANPSRGDIATFVDKLRNYGQDVSLVEPEEIDEEFPILRTDDIVEAAITRNAGFADPHSYATMVGRKLAEMGVNIQIGSEARLDVDPLRVIADGEATEFDSVLVAAGVHSKQILADIGETVPLKPYRVQALTCSPLDRSKTEFASQLPMVYDVSENYYFRPDSEGLLGGGGDGSMSEISNLADWKERGDMSFLSTIAPLLENRLPGASLEASSSWAGVCAATPDQDPLLGAVADEVFVAAGWQGHGFMQSPGAGECIAQQMLGGSEIRAFSPTRFTGDEEFTVETGIERMSGK